MNILSEDNNAYLLSISYDRLNDIVKYCLSVGGELRTFSASTSADKKIKCITYIDGFDELIMSLMPLQPKIPSIIGRITWDYIAGREVILPFRIVP